MKNIELVKGYTTIVDDEDYASLATKKWGIISNKSSYVYAARGTRKNGVYNKILMHRVLMNAPSNMMVDHINGNTLDNRKENLRIVSRAENLQNSKLRKDSKCKHKGVSKRGNKYSARIQINTKTRLFLGYFDTEEQAANAYNKASLTYFKEFAKLNVIK